MTRAALDVVMRPAAAAAIRAALAAQADPEAARAMARYMRTEEPFHGVKNDARRAIVKAALAAHPVDDAATWRATVLDLWAGPRREERYAALDVAEAVRRHRADAAAWDLFVGLLRSAGWWDTVDRIATRLLGPLLLADPTHEADVGTWAGDPDPWVRRAAVIVRLKHGPDTDRQRLAQAILANADDPDFFLRKAIGWALREFGRHDPEWVRGFVDEHAARLSPLSRREATRALPSPPGPARAPPARPRGRRAPRS